MVDGFYLGQESHFGLHQQQKLMMNLAMQQALSVMQLPILELSEWLNAEIENNPALEIQLPEIEAHLPYERKKSVRERPKELLENLLSAPISLFDHLLAQARCHISDQNTLTLAQWIIGHLDERGFLSTPLEELSELAPIERVEEVLHIIQTFDPPGIAARNLQESLLIQLKYKQKEKTPAFVILRDHFDKLLHNHLPALSRQLNLSLEEIYQIIKEEITPLDLHPGYRFMRHHASAIVPDLLLYTVDDAWKIEVNHAFLPRFYIAPTYRAALAQNALKSEERAYLCKHLTAGKWLKQIIAKRHNTLQRIGKFLLEKQSDFFSGGTLIPLTLAEAAVALGLHESTIARAVTNKFIACPQGMFALKDLFPHGLRGEVGEKISHRTLRNKLKQLVDGEDKMCPLSDATLSLQLGKSGIPCARRTVTKYRKLLHIAPASKRRRWH